MESLQNGRLDFRKGQPIEKIDRGLLHDLGSALSPFRSTPLHQVMKLLCPAPGIIVETSCDSLMSCMVQSFAIFGGVYAFASCIAQRLRQKQDGGPIASDMPAACLTGLMYNEYAHDFGACCQVCRSC